jgi:hypothetical protein
MKIFVLFFGLIISHAHISGDLRVKPKVEVLTATDNNEEDDDSEEDENFDWYIQQAAPEDELPPSGRGLQYVYFGPKTPFLLPFQN